MRKFAVTKNEEGLSVVKLSRKLLPEAPSSLIFKFIRNKNIELNGRKTQPEVILKAGDELSFFLSDETYDKFSGTRAKGGESRPQEEKLSAKRVGRDELSRAIIYEDDNILLINKPAGLLSQGDETGEVSLNDLILDYLNYDPKRDVIKPSICNRLDKNTSGLLAAGKSASALAELNRGFSERYFKKTYCLICETDKAPKGEYRAYLMKDRVNNTALIRKEPAKGYKEIITSFYPEEYFDVEYFGDRPEGELIHLCLLKAELKTGKPHQIRAHLKALGCPVLGDRKYFTPRSREVSEKLSVKRQLLHSFSLKFDFPGSEGALAYLQGKEFVAPLPEDFRF